MRKKLIMLLSIALVSGILISALVFLSKNPPGDDTDETPSDNTVTIYKEDEENIISLTAENEHGSFTIIKGTDDSFEVKGLAGYPVNDSKVSSAISSASSFTARRIVAENAEDLSVYGLDSPAASYTIKFKDRSYNILIGDEVPGSTNFYAKEKDGDKIYISEESGNLAFWFEKKLGFIDLYLSENIAAEDQANIKSITLGGSVRPKEIVLEAVPEKDTDDMDDMDTFKIVKPLYFSPNIDKLTSLISDICTGIYATEAISLDVSDKNLKKYGLDKPFSIMSYVYEEKTYSISLGKKDETDSTYYALVKGGKVIYKVYETSVPYIDLMLEDILSNIMLVYIDRVESISVKTKETETIYKLTGEEDELVVKANGKTVDTDNFRSLYQLLMGSLRSSTAEGDIIEKAPSLSITFNFRDKKRAPVKSEYYKIDIRNYKKYIDNTPINVVSVSYIDKVIKSMQDLLDGKEINTNY